MSGRVVRARPHETLALGMQEIGSGNTETVPLVAVNENASKRTMDKGEQRAVSFIFSFFFSLSLCVCVFGLFVCVFSIFFFYKRTTECIIPY